MSPTSAPEPRSPSRITTILCIVTLVVAGASPILPALAAEGGDGDADSRDHSEAWSKMDEPLRKALGGDPAWARWIDDQGRLGVLLTGPPHPTPEDTPTTRQDWKDHWQRQAAPLEEQVASMLRSEGEVVSTVPATPMVKVRVQPEHVDELVALDEVAIAGLDWPEAVQLLGEVDTDDHGGPTHLSEAVALTGAFDVHKQGFQGQGIELAVIDTGIDGDHPMFLDEFGDSRVTKWVDVTDDPCETPCDHSGHGTHTASSAAGSNVSDASYQAPAPRATLYGVRVFGEDGGGGWGTAQAGLQAAFDMGADVASNSWGGGCSGSGKATAQLAAELAEAGMQSVFSAGNGGPGAAGDHCPGRHDAIISVAATDGGKQIAGFSSGGPCPDENGNLTRTCPDISAVGDELVAAKSGGGYTTYSGTSMSTPQVAGVAALMMQINRGVQDDTFNVSDEELETFLESHAEDIHDEGNDNRTGWGFVQAKRAANELLADAQARVTPDVSVARSEMHKRHNNRVTFNLENVATSPVAGDVTITASGGFGHEGQVYLTEAHVTLAPGESIDVTATLPGEDLNPTTQHVVGTYDYAYTSDDGGTVEATVEAFETFLLRAPYLAVDRSIEPSSETGRQQEITLTVENVGTEAGTDVALQESIPLEGYALQPGTSSRDLGQPSTPYPDEVSVDAANRTLDLHFALDELASGERFAVEYDVRNEGPGNHTFQFDGRYTDGVGDRYGQTLSQDQTLRVPLLSWLTSS